jgi:hypothetical protein
VTEITLYSCLLFRREIANDSFPSRMTASAWSFGRETGYLLFSETGYCPGESFKIRVGRIFTFDYRQVIIALDGFKSARHPGRGGELPGSGGVGLP